MVQWIVGSILRGVVPLSYFSFQPGLHDWCNKGHGLWDGAYKITLLLIGKSSPCGGSGFHLSISKWSFTICPTPYNRKIKCVECVVKYNISFLLTGCIPQSLFKHISNFHFTVLSFVAMSIDFIFISIVNLSAKRRRVVSGR